MNDLILVGCLELRYTCICVLNNLGLGGGLVSTPKSNRWETQQSCTDQSKWDLVLSVILSCRLYFPSFATMLIGTLFGQLWRNALGCYQYCIGNDEELEGLLRNVRPVYSTKSKVGHLASEPSRNFEVGAKFVSFATNHANWSIVLTGLLYAHWSIYMIYLVCRL